jgi:hypothetical protein
MFKTHRQLVRADLNDCGIAFRYTLAKIKHDSTGFLRFTGRKERIELMYNCLDNKV